MANNTHTYTVTETLPPGRFLNIGEKILEGDLSVESDRPAEDTGYHIGETLHIKGFIYRPDPVKPPVTKQRHDGLKCQKGWRFLDADEIVQKGDEFEFVGEIKGGSEDWWKVDTNIGQIAGESLFDDTVYRRKLPKKLRVRKTGYRFLKEGEIVKKGDDYNWSSINFPNWEKVMPAIYGEKGGYAVTHYAVTHTAATSQWYRRRLR